MISHDIRKLELNISFCTFKKEDINGFVKIFSKEKNKAAEELKRIYEQSSSEQDVVQENWIEKGYQIEDIVKRLKKLEERIKHEGSNTDMFGMQVKLSFRVTAGKRTVTGSDWPEVLSRVQAPINTIEMKLECPDLQRRITIFIKEHFSVTGPYQNRYEICGIDPDWINEVGAAFDDIIANCKNNREHWYNKSHFFELVFGSILAGSIFLILNITMLVLNLHLAMATYSGLVISLTSLLFYIFVWIFMAAGLARRFFEYVMELFPSVEILWNQERTQKRKTLRYVFVLVVFPYFLNLICKLTVES